MGWSRFILYPLIVFQALFLNVLLPGHTRGQITLDGTHSEVGRACCCGGESVEQPSTAGTTQNRHAPSQRDKDCCAICSFAARVTPAPVISFRLDELGLLELLPLPPPSVAVSIHCSPTYLGRGPPAVAL